MTSLPGVVDPLRFAKARANEVLLLKKEIEDSRYRGSRRVFQTLPRSMRRRAASYNIRRLPIRLRQRALEETAKDPETAPKRIKKPPCRRRRRRPANIQEEFGKRQQNKKWLETHMWHAKRARMQNLWGHRIAIKSNEKCLKSCLRASLQGCFLYDCSYFGIVEFSRNHAVCDILFNSEAILKLGTGEDLYFYTFLKTEDNLVLGPAYVIVDTQIVRLVVHPLIAEYLKQEYSLVLNEGDYSMFFFEGPQVLEILKKILLLKCLPLGTISVAQDPRFGALGSFPLRYTSLWNKCENAEGIKQRKTEKQLDELREKQPIPGTKLVPEVSDPTMPFALFPYFDNAAKGKKKWLFIVPNGWGAIIWRCLIKAKVRFGTLHELRFVDAEQGRPFFPDDFASSPLFRKHNDNFGAELEAKWNQKPPAKRMNYTRMGIESPFRVSLLTISSSIGSFLYPPPCLCRIECVGRGVPEYNARVYKDSMLVGFVTSGYYSQRSGKGIAFATCYNVDKDSIVNVQNLDGPKRVARIVQIIIN